MKNDMVFRRLCAPGVAAAGLFTRGGGGALDAAFALRGRLAWARWAWLAPVLAFAGCGGAGAAAHANDAREGDSVGQSVPDLELAGLHGGKGVHLRELRGKVVLVDVWASWCAPCKEELPMLDDMSGRLDAKGIRIVAVSIDESRDDAEAFLKSRPSWSIELANDPEGKTLGILQPPKMPSSFIVDREGVVRAVNAGFTRGDAEKMEARLVEVADAPSTKTETAAQSTVASETAKSESKASPPESRAPSPESAASRPALTGSGDLEGQPFEPKTARLIGRKNGRAVLSLSDRTDCSLSTHPKPGEATLTLMVPWKAGYEADLASLKHGATFSRVNSAKKSEVLKDFKPTGTVKIVAAPVTRNAVGKMSIQLAHHNYSLAGDVDVLVCLPLK